MSNLDSLSMKLLCDCGCNQEAYHNKLVVVEVEQAIDESLRQTSTAKRFWVRPQCKEPFEEELAISVLLQQLVRAWLPKQKTWRQKWNVPLTFYNWCRRVSAAFKVMRLQHARWERTRGFEYAHDRAVRSAIMFGAPRFLQGVLARHFTRRLQKHELHL